jgi:tetratricopeptide (TPR) repeat protein
VTDLSNQSEASEGAAAPEVRLAIFESVGMKKDPVGIVAALKGADGRWSLQCSAKADVSLQKLRSVADRYAASQRDPTDADSVRRPDIAKLTASFRDAGYFVEVIPAGDHELSFQLDLNRGTMIGTHSPLHSLATPDDPLIRRLLEGISESFTQACEDLARGTNLLLDANDAGAAIKAIKVARENGIFSLPPSKPLFDALLRIDVSTISAEDRRFIREHRLLLAHRLGEFAAAGDDAEALLIEDTDVPTADRAIALRTTVALGEIKKGHRETGLSILRDLLKQPNQLNAEARGWTWRNIALALDRNDPEARRAAQLSADAFLESGNKQEASKSLMHLANLLMDVDPSDAVARLNEMISYLDVQGLLDRHVRSAALHSRASRLARLNQHNAAFQDACEAVNLLRGLLGADEAFVSSLHLAAIEARQIGDESAAKGFEEEADRLTETLNLPHFRLAKRVAQLTSTFDAKEASNVLREAEAADNLEVIIAIRVLQATLDTSLSDTKRLQILEDAHDRAASGRDGILKPVQLAIGQLLVRTGHPDRAESWFREILVADALDAVAQDGLIDCLWRQGKWGDAAIFLRKQLALKGEIPGLTFALGKSQLEAGDLSGAVTTLTKLISRLCSDEPMFKVVSELRERALRLGGTILPSPPTTLGPVSRDEFETALDEFAQFIASEKRMRFWVKSKSKHRWTSAPERLGQDLLHTALKSRFGERVEIFEELSTGAGRLDLYARFEGGLAVIVELKMCGAPYSSTYAASGEGQIKHYMENRRTHLGYLVVFDGRAKQFGKALLQAAAGPYVVVEKIVDVRNRVQEDQV